MAGISADQLRRLFAQEAEGRLVELGQLLLQLERTGGDEQLVRSLYREFHTLKGSAAVAGLGTISRIAHDLEELANTLRLGGQPVTAEVIEIFRVGTDQLSTAIGAVQSTSPQPAPSPPVRLERWGEISRLIGETAATHQRLGRVLNERFSTDPATLVEFNDESRLLSELQKWVDAQSPAGARTERPIIVPLNPEPTAAVRTPKDSRGRRHAHHSRTAAGDPGPGRLRRTGRN